MPIKEALKKSSLSIGALIYGCCFFSTCIACLILFWVSPQDPEGYRYRALWSTVFLGAGSISFGFAVYFLRRSLRTFIYSHILAVLLCTFTLAGCEFIARSFAPGWPAMGLHGVAPDKGNKSWGRAAAGGVTEFNSWGQRDKERSLKKPGDKIRRIAFIGDSFLEESTNRPVSLTTEALVGNPAIEIINLGVSASGVDEYYFRIKEIAEKIDVDEYYVFIYPANDILSGATLPSFYGIWATYPRVSLFSRLHLFALNHFLTNQKRPLLKAWGMASELAKKEDYIFSNIKNTPDDELMPLFMRIWSVPQERAEAYINFYKDKDLTDFYAMLRNPDKNLFRSYYLIRAISRDAFRLTEDAYQYSYRWIKRIDDFIRKKNKRVTFILIPEAFEVDLRMQRLWSPMSDMKHLLRGASVARIKLNHDLTKDKISFADLSHILAQEGTYLNLDGHWSEKGAALVSKNLAVLIKGRFKR